MNISSTSYYNSYSYRLTFLMVLLTAFIVSCLPGKLFAQNRFVTTVQITYSWKGDHGNDFGTPENWLPKRDKPACHDILVFGKTDTISISAIPFNTVGRIKVLSAAKVSFELATDTAQTLYICQPSVNSIDIASNASLSFLGKAPLHLKLYGDLCIKGKLYFSQQAAQSIWVGGNLYGQEGMITMSGHSLSHLLTLEGEINEITSFISFGSSTSTVSYIREGEQKVFPSMCYQTLNLGGSGSKYASGILSVCTALLVEETARLASRGHLVKLNGRKIEVAY